MPTRVAFNVLARTLGLFGASLLSLFGIMCFFYPNGTGNGAYAVILGPVFAVFLWPVWRLKVLLLPTQIYWLMAVVMGGASVFPFFVTPTIIPGLFFVFSALLYVVAAVRREKRLTAQELKEADDSLWTKM